MLKRSGTAGVRDRVAGRRRGSVHTESSETREMGNRDREEGRSKDIEKRDTDTEGGTIETQKARPRNPESWRHSISERN